MKKLDKKIRVLEEKDFRENHEMGHSQFESSQLYCMGLSC